MHRDRFCFQLLPGMVDVSRLPGSYSGVVYLTGFSQRHMYTPRGISGSLSIRFVDSGSRGIVEIRRWIKRRTRRLRSCCGAAEMVSWIDDAVAGVMETARDQTRLRSHQ